VGVGELHPNHSGVFECFTEYSELLFALRFPAINAQGCEPHEPVGSVFDVVDYLLVGCDPYCSRGIDGEKNCSLDPSLVHLTHDTAGADLVSSNGRSVDADRVWETLRKEPLRSGADALPLPGVEVNVYDIEALAPIFDAERILSAGRQKKSDTQAEGEGRS
jgi:hypothetical protein